MPTKVLVDPSTGTQYEVDMGDLAGSSGNGSGSSSQVPQSYTSLPQQPQAIEQQLQWFLESHLPEELKELFFTLNHLLAITKIVDPWHLQNAQFRVENLIRMYYLTHIDPKIKDGATEEKIMFWLEQLEVYCNLMLYRSITWDDRPTEREHWSLNELWQRVMPIPGENSPGSETSQQNQSMLSAAWQGLKRRLR